VFCLFVFGDLSTLGSLPWTHGNGIAGRSFIWLTARLQPLGVPATPILLVETAVGPFGKCFPAGTPAEAEAGLHASPQLQVTHFGQRGKRERRRITFIACMLRRCCAAGPWFSAYRHELLLQPAAQSR